MGGTDSSVVRGQYGSDSGLKRADGHDPGTLSHFGRTVRVLLGWQLQFPPRTSLKGSWAVHINLSASVV